MTESLIEQIAFIFSVTTERVTVYMCLTVLQFICDNPEGGLTPQKVFDLRAMVKEQQRRPHPRD